MLKAEFIQTELNAPMLHPQVILNTPAKFEVTSTNSSGPMWGTDRHPQGESLFVY